MPKTPKPVEPIEITDEIREKCTEYEIRIFEFTNKLMEGKLCGLQLTLDNGWKVSFKNTRFAKQIQVPMK